MNESRSSYSQLDLILIPWRYMYPRDVNDNIDNGCRRLRRTKKESKVQTPAQSQEGNDHNEIATEHYKYEE